MYLNANEFTGSIPPEIGNLTNLMAFGPAENQFSGQLPTEMGKLRELTHLWLYLNRFNGTLPTELGNLEELTVCDHFGLVLLTSSDL
jgi:hypothetical protein